MTIPTNCFISPRNVVIDAKTGFRVGYWMGDAMLHAPAQAIEHERQSISQRLRSIFTNAQTLRGTPDHRAAAFLSLLEEHGLKIVERE